MTVDEMMAEIAALAREWGSLSGADVERLEYLMGCALVVLHD